MRTLVHLSDLHFGRTNPAILSPLIAFIEKLRPDLIAISGDLTQRARKAEFVAAQQFLGALPFPQIVVPGNHDVPLHNLFKRFARSLDRYRRHISDDLYPFFLDDEIAVAGVNTARAWTWKDGRIDYEQLRALRDQFAGVSANRTRIVVTHHPFDLPAGAHGRVVGRSQRAMDTLADCRVDLLLSGHFHIADVGYTAKRYELPGYSALIVASGTSTSTRGRGQPNSLNVIRIEFETVVIERHLWAADAQQFHACSTERFHRGKEGWIRE